MFKTGNRSIFLLILLIPTLIYSTYSLMRNDLTGFIVTFSSFAGFSALLYYLFGKAKPPTKVDERLVTILLHMYAISHGEVGPDDLVKVIAENREYGYYSRVFQKLREIATKFGYGFTKAASKVASTVKPPLKDILVRFTEIFSTTEPKGYLELETSTIIEEYSGYYLRAIESLRVLGGVFSTFQSVAIFIIMTLDILTVFMSDQSIVYFSYVISTCVMLLMYLGLRTIAPKDKLVYVNRRIPSRPYKVFLSSLYCSTCIAPAVILALNYGVPYGMILTGLGLTIPGIFAHKLESFVYKIDDHYPTFIKSLGENMASTSNLKSALSYVLYMDLGPLQDLLKRTLARAKMGISNEKSLDILSSEASSQRVHSTNKIFIDAVNYGGDPLEVGKILGNNFVKFLEFRKRRMSVAKSFEAVVYILQPITVALLIILTNLCQYFSQYLTALPYFTFGEMPLDVINAGNIFIILFITAINALGLKEAKGGYWGKTLLYAGILLTLSGAAWLAAEKLMDTAMGQLLTGFEEII